MPLYLFDACVVRGETETHQHSIKSEGLSGIALWMQDAVSHLLHAYRQPRDRLKWKWRRFGLYGIMTP